MSNKSSGKPNQALSKFAEMLRVATERQRELNEQQNIENGETFETPHDLPLPTCQEVTGGSFKWTWEALPDVVHVHAYYLRKADVGENWCVELVTVRKILTIDPEQAKAVGEALLAAYAYQYKWKEHVADYMIGEKKTIPPLLGGGGGGKVVEGDVVARGYVVEGDVVTRNFGVAMRGNTSGCSCEKPDDEGVHHRSDGPCYLKDEDN